MIAFIYYFPFLLLPNTFILSFSGIGVTMVILSQESCSVTRQILIAYREASCVLKQRIGLMTYHNIVLYVIQPLP